MLSPRWQPSGAVLKLANLTFSTSHPGTCPRLLVSEGEWPPFLGLGYAASPFTARVEWRLCEIAG